jgi:hypothetical protein
MQFARKRMDRIGKSAPLLKSQRADRSRRSIALCKRLDHVVYHQLVGMAEGQANRCHLIERTGVTHFGTTRGQQRAATKAQN